MIGSPTKSAAAPAQAFFVALRQLVRALNVHTRHSQDAYGLSGAQRFALSRLQAAGGELNLKALAATTLTDLSSASVVASRLRARGLVKHRRSPADGRAVLLSLSPKGRALLRRSHDPLQERLLSSLERLPKAEQRSLVRSLRRLLKGAGLDQAPAPLFFEDEA